MLFTKFRQLLCDFAHNFDVLFKKLLKINANDLLI